MPEEIDDNQNDNAQGGGGLRKQLEQALEALKTQKEELAKFQARDRVDTVKGLLKAKGAPEGAASFYTAEDVSEGAVDKWLQEHASVFAVSGQAAQQQAVVDPNAQAAQRVADASFGTVTEPLGANAALGDPAELMKLFQTASDEDLVKLGLLRPQTGKTLVGGYTNPR
jgi:hypothetical protein